MGTIARMWSPRGFSSKKERFWVNPREQIVFQACEASLFASVALDFPRSLYWGNQPLLAVLTFMNKSKPGEIPIGEDMPVYFYGTKTMLKVLAISNGRFLVQFSETIGAQAIGITVQNT